MKALIAAVRSNGDNFSSNIRRKHVWYRIATQLNKGGGTQFTGDEVGKKWRNLKDR